MAESAGIQMTSFELVAAAGTARSIAMEALKVARDGDVAAARAKLEESRAAFEDARDAQHQIVETLFDDESKITMDPLFVHAQDQLMTALFCQDMVEELICVYERLSA